MNVIQMEERTDQYWIRLQSEPIDVGTADAFLRTEVAGAIDIFLGTTRRWTDGRETSRLEYESYPEMVLAEMKRLIGDAAERWPVAKICLWHREGVVPLREASVLIGVATPHRTDAFEACRFLIDELKERVPIWKKELYADGSVAWVEGRRSIISGEEEDKR